VVGVQGVRDCFYAAAGGVLLKDAADDGRLGRITLETRWLTALRTGGDVVRHGDGAIAERAPTGAQSRRQAAVQAAMRFGTEVLDVERRH